MVSFETLFKEALNVLEYYEKGLETRVGSTWKEEFERLSSSFPKSDAEKFANLLLESSCKILAYSAYWCPDCRRNVMPLIVVQKLVEKELPIRVKGGIKTAPKDPNRKWAIPPSPPEMEELNIKHIPMFYLLNSNYEPIGFIEENPRVSMLDDFTMLIKKVVELTQP